MSAKGLGKGLGRGFESLIPTDLLDESFDPTAQQDEKMSRLREIALTSILPDPDQPRRRFEEDPLTELTDSIRLHGVLQPIIVIETNQASKPYQIVAGERRWRAASRAGLETIPALVRSLDGQHKLEVSLIENLQRTDLNAIEMATAYQKLRDQFNLTLDQIGERVNKSAVAVSNTMRLLKLPKAVQKAIDDGLLTEGQARPLIGQEDAFVAELLPVILKEGWSARKIEQYMVDAKAKQRDTPKTQAVAAVDDAVVQHWQQRLGTPHVAIRTNSRGAGQITIKFKNQAELKKIENLLG